MATEPEYAWPAPAFNFRVRLGRKEIAFESVTGIETLEIACERIAVSGR